MAIAAVEQLAIGIERQKGVFHTRAANMLNFSAVVANAVNVPNQVGVLIIVVGRILTGEFFVPGNICGLIGIAIDQARIGRKDGAPVFTAARAITYAYAALVIKRR